MIFLLSRGLNIMFTQQDVVQEVSGLVELIASFSTDGLIALGLILFLLIIWRAFGYVGRGFELWQKYLDDQKTAREKDDLTRQEQMAVQERTANAIEHLNNSEQVGIELTSKMVESFQEMKESNQKLVESQIKTAATVDRTHAAVTEGFRSTEEQITQIPDKLAEQIKPMLERMDKIQTEIEKNVTASERLAQEFTDTRLQIVGIITTATAPAVIQPKPEPKPDNKEDKAA